MFAFWYLPQCATMRHVLHTPNSRSHRCVVPWVKAVCTEAPQLDPMGSVCAVTQWDLEVGHRLPYVGRVTTSLF